MKVRVIRKPQYTALHHVQVKRWWWPFWMTVSYDDRARCEEVARNLLKNGHGNEVVMEGETK
jgi:hypothetical protein